MVFSLLTKSGGPLGPIASLLGLIMNGIYEFFSLFGIQNIALSIIVFTFITRALMLPLTIKQQKFTKLQSKMNPEIQKIAAKYKGKKDEASLRKQQAETQAVYEKYGASQVAGCLPLLISLPIMLALYQVINNIPAYVSKVKDIYVGIASQGMNETGFVDKVKELAKGTNLKNFDTTNDIISALAKFTSDKWNKLADAFPQLASLIDSSKFDIHQVNDFFGVSITKAPGFTSFAVVIPFIAAALSYVQSKQLQSNNKDANKDNPAASAMNSMNVVMPIMQLFFCFTFPVGIGIYWIATSVFTIIQQYFVNKYLDRISVDELIQKNLEKASKRKKHTDSKGMSLQELAKTQTKTIESISKANYKNLNDTVDSQESKDDSQVEKDQSVQSSTGPKSISEIANLLKNREKGDK